MNMGLIFRTLVLKHKALVQSPKPQTCQLEIQYERKNHIKTNKGAVGLIPKCPQRICSYNQLSKTETTCASNKFTSLGHKYPLLRKFSESIYWGKKKNHQNKTKINKKERLLHVQSQGQCNYPQLEMQIMLRQLVSVICSSSARPFA